MFFDSIIQHNQLYTIFSVKQLYIKINYVIHIQKGINIYKSINSANQKYNKYAETVFFTVSVFLYRYNRLCKKENLCSMFIIIAKRDFLSLLAHSIQILMVEIKDAIKLPFLRYLDSNKRLLYLFLLKSIEINFWKT